MKRNRIGLKELLKTPRFLGENPLFTLFILLALALIAAGLVFYYYSVLPGKVSQYSFQKPLQVEENVYKKVLEAWKTREERSNETETKVYPDPFKAPAPSVPLGQ